MMKKLTCLLIALFFVLASCSKDDDNTIVNTNPNEVLLQRTVTKMPSASNSSATTFWFYNGKKLAYTQTSQGVRTNYFYTDNLITRIEKVAGGVGTSSSYSYDDSERLISISVNGNVTATYTYNSDETVTVKKYNVSNELVNTQNMFFTDGEISKIVTNFEADAFETTYYYSYDNKNSPTKNIVGFDKIYLNLNYPNGNFKNVISRYYADNNGDAGEVTKNITYNALDFPVLVNSNDYFGVDTYVAQYFYQ